MLATESSTDARAADGAHVRAVHSGARAGVHACARAGGLRLAIAGGGTGGHLVPGLHLLAHVRMREQGLPAPLDDLVLMTSGRAVEERVLAGLDAELDGIPCERVVLPLEPEKGGAPSRRGLVLRTPAAFARARRALLRHESEVLLGLGGFTSLPAVLAARSLGIPVALIEINAEPGSATRWLRRFATRVFHAWRATLPAHDTGVDRWIGPPLAPSFTSADTGSRAVEAARRALGFAPEKELLLVLGGSQGSSALNRFVRTHAPALVAHEIQVLHQTGPAKLDEAAAPFSGYRAQGYLAAVDQALVASTFVLCRGGASTLAEIAAIGRPACVVPYPHHVDRHQERNAEELGAGVRIVDEARLDVGFRAELIELCSSSARARETRQAMSAALASAVPTDAARRLYSELVELARAGTRRGSKLERARSGA